MATITAQPASGNAALTYTAATSGGDTVALGASQRGLIVIRNASGASVTVTIADPKGCSDGFTHNITKACATGVDTEINVPTPRYTDASGNVGITYSSSTSVSVAALTS